MSVADSSSALQGLFNDALRHHQAGRLAEAAELYRQVLAVDARHAHTLQLLGLVAHQSGRHGDAVELIGRAIDLRGDEPVFHLHMGLALKSQGSLDKAVASYDRALRLKPDFAEAHNNRSVALRAAGATDAALTACERALACRPDFAEAHSNRGDILQDLGRPDEALASYDRALALRPALPPAHYGRGNALLALGKPAEAIASFDRALALRPDHAEGHARRADALYRQGSFGDALAGYDRALALAPGFVAAHHSRANVLRDGGAHDLAIAGYDQAIALAPDVAEAHYHRGDTLSRKGELGEAIASYDRALALRPDFAAAHVDRGTALKNRGQLDEAIAAYDRAIELGADFALVHAGRAEALHRQARLEDALAGYERALALDPAFTVAHHGHASVLYDLRRLEEALASYDRALGLAPELADIHHNRANVLNALARYDEAVAGYDRALALQPDFAMAHYNRGNSFNNQDRFDEAIACYDRAIALKPDHAMAHFQRGTILSVQGKLAEALACYDRAIELMPEHAATHSNRGVVLRNQGLADAAAESFERARELEPLSFEYATLAKLSLPVIPSSTSDIVDRRARYRQGLADLMQLDGTLKSLDVSGTSNIFYLAYHGLDDRAVLEEIGAFFRAKGPPSLAFEAPHVTAWRPPQGRRLRIGFASEFFREHTIEKLYRGLVRHLDRTRFEIVLIHAPRGKPDGFSERLGTMADKVVKLPSSLPLQHQALSDECLDVLFYPDIGMSKDMYFLAYARLAPVQAVSWGHPNTTGLDSIDYFVSADGAEPEGAERHYSERLIRLSRLPCFYERPELPEAVPDRRELGLPERGTLYGCPQSLFKFHPDFDAILAAILAGDPEGHIIVMQGVQAMWTDLLRQRWARSHPSLLERVLVRPFQHTHRFIALLSRIDVLLDPIHFGSGNTLYEAMIHGTPIVTWPAHFMRGRIVAAAYRQIGVADAPIAERLEDYAPLAVALGRDPARREALRRASRAAAGALFEDRQAVRDFEAFLTAAVEAAGRNQKLPAGWRPSRIPPP